MGRVYIGQTALRIYLACGVNISSTLAERIYYRKPSGIEEYWEATVSDDLNGIMYYDIQESELDEAGEWRFWSYIKFNDGTWATGESVTMMIYEAGE